VTGPRIQVLPTDLANQIAAGEVVERPASVVKELAENSLDAGARRVDIEIENGGRRLVRVVDDGGGMTPEEARLAVQRHATSKLKAAADLWSLSTFGFRGEALPSIAAVARMTLSTRTPESDAGFRLALEGGRETEAREVGMPQGTQIEVRDLFFNQPARLKFQKTDATESGNVSEALLRLSLGHPSAHIRLRSGGRVMLDLPPHRDLGERVRAALGRRGVGALHEARGREGSCEVHAFLGSPDETAGTSRNVFLMVGRRFVRDKNLLHALAMGYGELLERGRYPIAVLFVDVPGDEVDVNVHPQKLEVRFANGQEVQAAVRHVVAASLARAPWLRAPGNRPYSLPPGAERAALGFSQPRAVPRMGDGAHAEAGVRASSVAAYETRSPSAPISPLARPSASPVPAALFAGEGSGFFASLRYLGQLERTYLLCEAAGELVILDQHAAHERVVFERIRREFASAPLARQGLLFPLPVDVGEALMAVFGEPSVSGTDAASLLARLGFDVEPFGTGTLLVRAVPRLLDKADPKPLIIDLLEGAAEGAFPRAAPGALEHVFATMACHAAVRAGDALEPEQVRALLMQMDGIDLATHCPHGRPVSVHVKTQELERRFGRT
jgi:DNA mismatch repair protein MutL